MAGFLLEKVQSLSVASSPRYFDSAIGRFGDTLTYEVSCYAVDIANVSNVSTSLVTALNALRTQEDYLDLVIKGKTLKNAKLIDFSFEEGTFHKYGLVHLVFEKYAAACDNEIPDDGLYECFNNVLAGSDVDYQTYFEDFSEGFDFSDGRDSTTYTYTLNIKLREQAGDKSVGVDLPEVDVPRMGGAPVAFAKEFATKIFCCADRPSFAALTFGDIVGDLYNTNYKKTYTESYDLISNTCSFSENFTTSNIVEADEDDHPYSLVVTQQSTRAENGLVTITEKGNIEGLGGAAEPCSYSHNKFADAEVGLGRELSGLAYPRIFNFFQNHISGDGDPDLARDCTGGLKFFSTHINRNKFEGTIGYSLSVNNDTSAACGCSGSYLIQDSLAQDGVYETMSRTISVKGEGIEISGKDEGATLIYPRFDNAKYLLLKEGVFDAACIPEAYSVYDYYTDTSNGSTCAPDGYSEWPTTENWNYNKKAGAIDVSLEYSNRPLYQYNGRGRDVAKESYEQFIKKYDIARQEEGPNHLFNKFPFLNVEEYETIRPRDEVFGPHHEHTGPNSMIAHGVLIQKKWFDDLQTATRQVTLVNVRSQDLSVTASQWNLDTMSHDNGVPRFYELMDNRIKPDLAEANPDWVIQNANYTYSLLNECSLTYNINYFTFNDPVPEDWAPSRPSP
mgnify:CR=1 FL=1